jgi:hypothetical protein
VEWAKALARTKRWTEDVSLVKEEMRRVPQTLRVKAGWWEDKRAPKGFSGAHAEGARTYAARQANLMRALADHFENMWDGLAELEEIPGEAERRAEELAEELAAGGGDDEDDDDKDDDETGAVEDEEMLEGDEEGSVGGEDYEDE